MKWYMAAGVKIESPEDNFCVRTGAGTKNLFGTECYIWNTLLWTFLPEDQIYGRMQYLLGLAFPENEKKQNVDKEDFKQCFQRLLLRGLIVSCEKETKEEAVRELFQESSVICVDRPWGERFLTFCESIAVGNPIMHSMQIFKKIPIERAHRQLLKKIRESGKDGFRLKGVEKGILDGAIELYCNRLVFVKPTGEGSIA